MDAARAISTSSLQEEPSLAAAAALMAYSVAFPGAECNASATAAPHIANIDPAAGREALKAKAASARPRTITALLTSGVVLFRRTASTAATELCVKRMALSEFALAAVTALIAKSIIVDSPDGITDMASATTAAIIA
jgi:hypothetical protein